MTTSRGESRVAASRRRSAAERVALDAIEEVADEVDVIIASTDSANMCARRCRDRALQRRRCGRPLCIVDMAVPRDIDPRPPRFPGVTLIDIDELAGGSAQRLDQRRETIPAAEKIIERELEKTVTVIGQRDTAGPTIAALVEWAEELRAREVARTFGAGEEIDEETRERIECSPGAWCASSCTDRSRGSAKRGTPRPTLAIREAFRLDR